MLIELAIKAEEAGRIKDAADALRALASDKGFNEREPADAGREAAIAKIVDIAYGRAENKGEKP